MKYLLPVLVSFLLTSCSSKKIVKTETHEESHVVVRKIKPILIDKGNLNGMEGITASNLVIKDEKTWGLLVDRINTHHNKINAHYNKMENVEIDFSNYTIIAIFDKTHTGLPDVEITSIVENIKNIEVTFRNIHMKMFSTFSQPYYIVKIPVSNKPIEFKKTK